ncbi:MAG: hypothetical protein AAF967_05750 [Pseudomonadota bacterium]
MAALFFARAGLVRMTRPLADYFAASRLVPALFNAVAIAASAMAVLVFVGGAGAIDFAWQGMLVLLLGAGVGLVLAGLLIAPYLRGFGGYTLPDFLAERFNAETMRPLGVFAVILCSFPALAAVLLGFGLLGQATLALPVWIGITAGAVFILVATLLGGMRSLSLSQLAYYVVMLLAGLVAIGTVIWQTGSIAAFDSLLVDEVIPSLPWQLFAQTSPINSLALFFCLATGFAALPFLLMRSFTAPDMVDARLSFLGAPIFLLLLCAALPALAALYEPAALAVGDVLSMIAQAVLVVAAVSALLATGAALCLSMASTIAHDLYFKSAAPNAPVSRQLLVARLSVVLLAALAGAAALLRPEETVLAAATALSLAASTLLPVLVLGIWWKRLGSDAAVAGMVAGLLVCLYYMIVPHLIPIVFYESSSLFSDATAAQAASFEGLRLEYYAANGEAAQAAALAEWQAAVRPIANWFGVQGSLAAVFAVPVGFLVTLVVGLFTSSPSARRQRFFDNLRTKPV